MKKYLVIILGIFTLFFSACAAEEQEITLNRKVLPMVEDGGISYGLYGLDGEIETEEVFTLEKGQPFEKILSVGNYETDDIEFTMVILADYQQMSFEVNHEECMSYGFAVPSGEAGQVAFSIDGIHEKDTELVILLFENLNNHTSDETFRKATDLSNFLTYTCVVNGSEEKNNDTSGYETMDVDYSVHANQDIDGILLNQEKSELLRCLELSGADMDSELFLHIGNTAAEKKKYIILFFDGAKVIPVNGKSISYIEMEPETMTDIPVKLQELNDNEIHELTVARFEIDENTNHVKRIDNTLRVGVNLP